MVLEGRNELTLPRVIEAAQSRISIDPPILTAGKNYILSGPTTKDKNLGEPLHIHACTSIIHQVHRPNDEKEYQSHNNLAELLKKSNPESCNNFASIGSDDEYTYQNTAHLGRFRGGRKTQEVLQDMRQILKKCGVSLPSTVQPVDSKSSVKGIQEILRKKSIPFNTVFLPFHKNDFKERDFIVSDPLPEKPNQRNRLHRIHKVVRFVVEDWLFLALLGIIMAICSLAMDLAIEFLQTWHVGVIEYANESTQGFSNIATTYCVWTGYAVALVIMSAVFVHYVAPQAIGSGIPEMKTILRGVILKEYLTFRTLVSKMVGLTLSLGSGMPIGKEGPFVHVASVVANLLSSMVQSFQGIYANESRSSEMLAAACAVGVSSTFSAPIGGECFTVVAFYQTSFPREAFFPEEIPVFALIGVICGFLSAAFIYIQRKMVLFLRKNKYAKSIFQKHWIIYPIVISLLVASLTYPKGFGKFLAGEKKFSQTAKDFFANCTWTAPVNTSNYCGESFLETWTGPNGEYSVFVNLSCFMVVYFFLTALVSTLPIPSGIFGPSFVFGAAIGRTVGELIATRYPDGIRGPDDILIFPGVYAVVGAAAFCGGVTHTVSVAVIVFELTGQLLYILPVMISVLIANAICSYLQPSIYDSIIKIKHLPYLPDIPHSSSNFHGIRVEQFMTKNVHFLNLQSNYKDAQNIILDSPNIKAFPVVENEQSKILIGSCSRSKLIRSLERKVGQESRQSEANRRIKSAIENIDKRFQMVDQKRASIAADKRPSLFEIHPTFAAPNQQATSEQNDVPAEPTRIKNEKENSKNGGRFQIVPVEKQDQPSTTKIARCESSCSGQDRLFSRRKGLAAPESPASLAVMSIEKNKDDLLSPPNANDRRRSLTVPSHSSANDVYGTIGGMIRTLTRFSVNRLRKSQYDTDYDLHGDERRAWEQRQLNSIIDFDSLGVDPAPFQLVENSSLFKVHSLFSLLGLSRAYVTKCGRLVGVVALKDLRVAVERAQNGQLSGDSPPLWSHVDTADKDNNPENDSDHHSSENSEEEEDDIRNDILTPRLEVLSRKSTMYGRDYDIETYKQQRANKASSHKRPSVVLKDAVNLLARGALSANSDPCLASSVAVQEDSDHSIASSPRSLSEYYQSYPSSPTSPTSKKSFTLPTILLTTEDDCVDLEANATSLSNPNFAPTKVQNVDEDRIKSRQSTNDLNQIKDESSEQTTKVQRSHSEILHPKNLTGYKVKKTPSWLGASKQDRSTRRVQIVDPLSIPKMTTQSKNQENE
uniref:Chloride channel protein n=1 Tax=Ditylenchus dipsaci TaxID=166011 RepID=A0A915DWI3_9BILA